jgi:hypothetical protein
VFVINGKKTVINLRVPITGKRPRKRTMIGDDEFERSRGRAMEAHDKHPQSPAGVWHRRLPLGPGPSRNSLG